MNREHLITESGLRVTQAADVADMISLIVFISTDIFVSCSCTCMCKRPSHPDHAHQRLSSFHYIIIVSSYCRPTLALPPLPTLSNRAASVWTQNTRSAHARHTVFSIPPTSSLFIAHKSCLSSSSRDACHCVWARPSRNHDPHSSYFSSARSQ